MKPEKEVLWLVNILLSNFKRRALGKSNGGCKSDFERIAYASLNNKEFHNLLNELIDEDILEFFEKKEVIGGSVDTYVVNEKKMMKKIRSTEFGGKFYKACINHNFGLKY